MMTYSEDYNPDNAWHLALALLAAMGLHGLVILGLPVDLLPPPPPDTPAPTLNVTLLAPPIVEPSSEVEPDMSTPELAEPSQPPPASPEPANAPEPMPKVVATPAPKAPESKSPPAEPDPELPLASKLEPPKAVAPTPKEPPAAPAKQPKPVASVTKKPAPVAVKPPPPKPRKPSIEELLLPLPKPKPSQPKPAQAFAPKPLPTPKPAPPKPVEPVTKKPLTTPKLELPKPVKTVAKKPALKPKAPKGEPLEPAVKKPPPLASRLPPLQGTPKKPTAPPPAPSRPKPAGKPSNAADLMNRGLQMARTGTAMPAKPGKAREKRINFSAMTTDERFYVRAWVQKVERVGNLNFPEAAKRLNRPVGPTLAVAVHADGSVKSIRVARSSGHQALDKAARQIVELAAPFAPFPEALRRQYDVLHIVRRWKFDRGQLSGQ